MKTAYEILKELAECENPLTASSIKPMGISIGSVINQLTAERDKYRKALESIASSTCCGDCQEAKRVAKSALDKDVALK